ncbi:GntR family transcriptional regulator [Cellulosilyticum sp. ST5]|uniref:GntR family transcriptional regulator n=1 Tax=unclassified Cellulosilyticum TaxID=2643091 RepID=UPI000F8D85E7|nr:GntR family transcriptional regulator [Cellulosilyticum sp. WCF-2]QEH68648.1 GntR family transcriptional regulator [Cellulosilyticum sp. WCF-2]
MIFDSGSNDKASLREKVFKSIRESILEGKYKPGDALREATIAKELNVSRTPVREAIRQLELEGLVQSIPNKETVVTGVSQEDVQDIFMIRSRLEGMAAKLAAERITPEELEKLKEVLELTEFYVTKKDLVHIGELDHRFHDMIYKATKSKILKQMLSDFHTYVQKTRMESLATPGRATCLLKEHTAIFKAIQNQDGEKAEELTNKHIEQVSKNMHLDDAPRYH